MKKFTRFASILLALAMIFVMALPAFALDEIAADSGSIFIENSDNVDASKKTFAAYKVLDLKAFTDENGEITTYDYSVPANLADFYAARYGLNKNDPDFTTEVVAHIGAEEDLYAFATAVLEAVTSAPYTGRAVDGGFQFTGLPLGYYVIEDNTAQGDHVKPVSALMLDTVVPDVEIQVKAEKPPIEKEIDEDGDLGTTEDRTDVNEASIGDDVTFVIESAVPDMTGYDKFYFIVKDTMSKGLSYNEDMVITVGDKTLVEGVDYTVTETNKEDGTTELRVVFNNFIQYNTAEFVGDPIIVSYTAKLNEDAVIYTEANTNTVKLEYSDDPTVDCEGENEPTEEDLTNDPTGETGSEETKTYTTALEIVKTDPLGNRLEGAKFTLTGESMNIVRYEYDVFTKDENGIYWKLTDGSYTTTDPNSTINGAPVDKTKYVSETVKYTKTTEVDFIETTEEKTVTGVVAEDGTLRFEGLGEGTYVIKEIEAPEGFNILTKELEVTITWNKETESYDYAGAVEEDGIARVTIVNKAGTELPSTGGIGTKIFYTLGGLMVLAAVVLLVSKKRMSANA